jgi:Protein of unknown function (DUF3455)
MQRIVPALLGLLVVSACVNRVPPSVPSSLSPAADERMIGAVAARGVQIYECKPQADQPGAPQWAFVAPEADLLDAHGRRIGTHYAGPHWEGVDGSKVAGQVVARAEAPRAGAVAWLRVATRSVGSDGLFARVTSIQRINTDGGSAPAATSCTPQTAGQRMRIAYTADYVLFGRN